MPPETKFCSDPTSVRVSHSQARKFFHTILIISKPGVDEESVMGIASFLLNSKDRDGKDIVVYVENKLKEKFSPPSKVKFWTEEMPKGIEVKIDLIITLGGDGTVLHVSSLFQRSVPPVLSFGLGSLGFLTNFDFKDWLKILQDFLLNGVDIDCRMRLECAVYGPLSKDHPDVNVSLNIQGSMIGTTEDKKHYELPPSYDVRERTSGSKSDKFLLIPTRQTQVRHVLNDLVIHRGRSQSLTMLDLSGNTRYMTAVQGDGLALSTPTGSTAYSLAAGGSLVDPDISAILITPICPHTLSFRPMMLSDSSLLHVSVPHYARASAWMSFDGEEPIELPAFYQVQVQASPYPFHLVRKEEKSADWFCSIVRSFSWNERKLQKPYVTVRERPEAEEHKTYLARREMADGEEEERSQNSNLDRPGGPVASSAMFWGSF